MLLSGLHRLDPLNKLLEDISKLNCHAFINTNKCVLMKYLKSISLQVLLNLSRLLKLK